MALELYDLVTLAAVQRQVKEPAAQFWLPSFFKKQINFDDDKIVFDRVYGDDRKLAPFVIPDAQGRPQSLAGYESWSVKPAYIKIKDVVHAKMHLKRRPGEALGGTFSIEQRRDAVIAELLRMQDVKINNRLEWLAARAIIDGKVTIEGEDYPRTLVDFRRDASLTITLAGAAKWDQPTADPLGDLYAARKQVNELSGARITKHVFGADAWDLFANHPNVDLKELMNINYGGQNVAVTLRSDGFNETMEFMGYIEGLNGAGRIEAWVNTARFIDPMDGLEKYFLDQKTVVGVSDMVDGTRCYGAIWDAEAQYQPLERFYKNWVNQDPSVEYLLTQSAPLMVPGEPNATYSIKVA